MSHRLKVSGSYTLGGYMKNLLFIMMAIFLLIIIAIELYNAFTLGDFERLLSVPFVGILASAMYFVPNAIVRCGFFKSDS